MVTLRVLTYNAHVLKDDLNAYTRVVRSVRPHVVIVQEAAAMWRWRSRNAELARRCGLVVFAGGGEAAAGNLLMGSVGVAVHSGRSVALRRLPFHRRRGAAIAVCSLAGALFTAAGAHLSIDSEERALQMSGLLDQLPADGPPVVLGADVNEQSDGTAWALAARRFRDVGAVDPRTPTFSCGSPSRRIDAIFADPAITPRAYRVLDSADVRRASDHFPVYAELELPT